MSGLLGQAVGVDEPLMEAGLDSIGAVELRNSVATKYGIDLPATITFDQPTVRALGDYLATMLAPRKQLRTDVGSFELVRPPLLLHIYWSASSHFDLKTRLSL